MKTFDIDDISTLSVQVTEEIEAKNLHSFLRTSILNSNIHISNSTYYFYYNKHTFTYEIVIYNNLSEHTMMSIFGVIEEHNLNDNKIKVYLTQKYFFISQNKKLLILKKVNYTNTDEISLYIEQIYKLKNFELILLKDDEIDSLLNNTEVKKIDGIYDIYPKKSFYIFSIFLFTSVIIFSFFMYTTTIPNNKEKPQLPIVQNIYKQKSTEVIVKLFEFMEDIKSHEISIEKIVYGTSKIETILYHKNKSHLLDFTRRYTESFQIEFLNYNKLKNMYQMKVTLEYKK